MNKPITHAIEKAIFALQQIAMAHPASDEHSREMYRIADDARLELWKILNPVPKGAS